MGLQANVSAPPATSIDVKRGVVTEGAATLSFFLANATSGSGGAGAAASASGPARGPHLFTLEVAGQLAASRLALEPDTPARPAGYRLAVDMQLVLPALKARLHIPASTHCKGCDAVMRHRIFVHGAGAGRARTPGTTWRSKYSTCCPCFLHRLGLSLHV